VKLFGNHWLRASLQYFFDSITNAGEFRHFLLREPEDRFQRFSSC
jgi:hypothetical protein